MARDSDLQAALALWSGFPVETSPRPLVLLPGRDVVAPLGGFQSTPDKEAWCDGAINAPASFPSAPETSPGLPIITAAEAFSVLRSSGDGQGSSTTLQVSGLRLDAREFDTDRGPQLLPAWLVALDGVSDSAAVLAVAPTARFAVPGVVDAPGIQAARLDVLGTTLTVAFTGGPPEGPAQTDYAVDVRESTTAVALTVRPTNTRPGVIRHAVGYPRNAEVTLRKPLGNRVLIEGPTGSPRPVLL